MDSRRAGLGAADLRQVLDVLDAFRGRVLLAAGGSALTALRTPASDFDLFLVGPEQAGRALDAALFSAGGFDVESRDVVWLESISQRLAAYSPNQYCELPPFGFYDLRFLVRTVLGRIIIPDGKCEELLRACRLGLRHAMTGYASVMFGTVYQDAYGLYTADRAEEIIPLAGELAQRACLTALLQEGLVDPAHKWAIPKLRQHDSDAVLRTRAGDLVRHLGSCQWDDLRGWSRSLLNAVNALLARAVLNRLGYEWGDGAGSTTSESQEWRDQFEDPRYTVIASLTEPALHDVVNRTVRACNTHYLAGLARWETVRV